MFLKSLTLKGFKSFADTTVMDLEPGVTVVVGPNGSGKSNVVDAIAWVLGAQAPSAVRSQKMDDVIFAGTAKRAALGRAEVTLTLDNSSGLLPLDASEVSVSRILFRTGESEYAINGVSCRLLDVQDLLSDAGVGRQQHVIVSQGQIDAVLNARPEDRRSIIEEAAGVLKFRKRKEKAERRLDATEASLLRVQDLLREVRRQLRPLERQAEAARRHGDLVAELNALRLFLSGREITTFRRRLEALAVERTNAGDKENELRRLLAELDTNVMAAEAELSARGDSGLSDELVRVEQLRERARGISMLLVERLRSYERDRGAMMDSGVVANLEADASRLKTELSEVESAMERLEPESLELANDEAAFEGERHEAATLFDHISSTTSAASAAAEVRGELRTLRASVESADSEYRRLSARMQTLSERDGRYVTEIERLRNECERAQTVEVPLVNEVTEAEARRLSAEAELETALSTRNAVASELARWQARSEALQLALDSARARAGAEKLKDVSGVVGTLLDLVVIDEGWEASVEAALGEALLSVVVENTESARRALAHLRSASTSGAVLALGAKSEVVITGLVPSGALRIRDHVRSTRKDVSDLLDLLLATSVQVKDWTAAVDAVMSDPRLVALGEIGLDFFVPALCEPSLRDKQLFFYHAQLKLAQKFKLPVILHVRKSADELLRGLRWFPVQGGIAHAFNGSLQQAEAFVSLDFALGFGGACTFDRALQLRRLATALPLSAIVLETDAPDIPPHWLYRTQTQRQLKAQGRNEPCELPKIGALLAQLRGLPIEELAQATVNNAKRVLPQLSLFIKTHDSQKNQGH